MAKIEIDDKVIDRLLGKREQEFNNTINKLHRKLAIRDNEIKKLKREVELLKADHMDGSGAIADRIAKISRALVGELERANWVEPHSECSVTHYADDCDK